MCVCNVERYRQGPWRRWHVNTQASTQHSPALNPALTSTQPSTHQHSTLERAQVACGDAHTLLLMDSGEVVAFGSNVCGQLGRQFESLFASREDVPLSVPLPNDAVVQVLALSICTDENMHSR